VGNFANVPDNGVPLITLVVTSDDGETFELLEGAEVIRDGDEFLVRARIGHFSTLVSIYEQQYAVIDTHQIGADLATEVGASIIADVSFFEDGGTPLTTPPGVAPSGWTRAAEVSFFDPDRYGGLGVSCEGLGEFRVGLRYDLTLPAEETDPAAPGLRATPQLTGSGAPAGIRFKFAAPLKCLDPDTAVTGRSVEGSVGTDHPGGQVLIPNENFRGGRSGLYGTFVLSPSVSWADPLVGLIEDSNRNGAVDPTDRLYPASPAGAEGEGLGFVAPLFGYGDYFLYTLDGADFDGGTAGPAPVGESLADLLGSFRGEGRFETSIGLLGIDGIPFVHSVGSGEGPVDASGELLIFITPQIVQGE
jgi:hypothetical protein